MFSLAHLVKGVGPSDLYLRSKSYLFLPPVYRPEMVITANSIHMKFPGSNDSVQYVDPSEPNVTYVAQRYRPLSLLYVLDSTTGECETSTTVPSRCVDFAAYITWFFSLLVGDLKYPQRINPATFGVRYDGVYPYSSPPQLANLVLDTVCYGIRSKCFTARVDDVLFSEILRELQYFWCYASLRVGTLNNSFVHKAVSEITQIPAFRCENRFPGSPVLALPGVPLLTTPTQVKKVPRIVYDTTKFTCVDVNAIEPLQLREEKSCKCVRVFATPYLKANLVPIPIGPNMPVPVLPSGFTSRRKPFLQIPPNARWGINTVSFDGTGAGVTVACPTQPFEEPRWPDPWRRVFASQVVPYIFGYSDIAGDCPPYTTCNVSNSNPELNYEFGLCGTYQAISFQSVSNRASFAPSSFIYAENYFGLECGTGDRYKKPVRGGAMTCVALLEYTGSNRPDGTPINRVLDTFTSGIPPLADTPDRPPDEPTDCFLTTNSITAVILNIQSGAFKFKTEVTISAPPLCESYAPKDVLGQLALLLDSYMDSLGLEYSLGPVSFTSDKGAPCQCP